MSISISFRKTAASAADTAVIIIFDDRELPEAAAALDRAEGGLLRYQLQEHPKFKGEAGQTLMLTGGKKDAYRRYMMVGGGAPERLTAEGCETIGGKAFAALDAAGAQRIHVFADAKTKSLSAAQIAAHMAMGMTLRDYRFEKYRGQGKKPAKGGKSKDADAHPASAEFITAADAKAKALYAPLKAAAAGVFLARDLVNEPPNELYPASFAKMVRDDLTPLGVTVEIIDDKKMRKMGFHAHLAVGMGSSRPPCVAIMRWNGAGKKQPLAFVGKGVTFDTGGVNLKPSDGMEDMKMDMGGAAAVAGLLKTLALRKAKINVVGIAGLAENMPSHTAYRPSDIIGSLSGKTIEVLNTDAEGRLVLADALTYVQRTYKPGIVIDLATLTGAIMVALGSEYCGAFVNNDDLWKKLEQVSKDTGEKLWRMPVDDTFRNSMEGQISDLRSLSTMGRYGGASSAAAFLQHFIEGDTPWAHLDIAGTAFIKADKATCPKPATGFGVRLLDRLIAEHYE